MLKERKYIKTAIKKYSSKRSEKKPLVIKRLSIPRKLLSSFKIILR